MEFLGKRSNATCPQCDSYVYIYMLCMYCCVMFIDFGISCSHLKNSNKFLELCNTAGSCELSVNLQDI